MKDLRQYILEAEGDEGEEKTTQRGKIKFVIWEEPEKKVPFRYNDKKRKQKGNTYDNTLRGRFRETESDAEISSRIRILTTSSLGSILKICGLSHFANVLVSSATGIPLKSTGLKSNKRTSVVLTFLPVSFSI